MRGGGWSIPQHPTKSYLSMHRLQKNHNSYRSHIELNSFGWLPPKPSMPASQPTNQPTNQPTKQTSNMHAAHKSQSQRLATLGLCCRRPRGPRRHDPGRHPCRRPCRPCHPSHPCRHPCRRPCCPCRPEQASKHCPESEQASEHWQKHAPTPVRQELQYPPSRSRGGAGEKGHL